MRGMIRWVRGRSPARHMRQATHLDQQAPGCAAVGRLLAEPVERSCRDRVQSTPDVLTFRRMIGAESAKASVSVEAAVSIWKAKWKRAEWPVEVNRSARSSHLQEKGGDGVWTKRGGLRKC
jgi:hypothetical protein